MRAGRSTALITETPDCNKSPRPPRNGPPKVQSEGYTVSRSDTRKTRSGAEQSAVKAL